MSDLIQLKRSSVANAAPTTLADGELALNFRDGKLYYRNHTGAIVEFAGGGGGDALLRSLFVPPAPTSLTASAANAQVSLSWTAPTVLAQTPITDYVVQFSTNSGSTWTTAAEAITITTQPSNQTAASGAATFSVTATVSPSGTATYQWQKSDDAGTTFSNVSGATSATLSLTSLTNASDNNDQYRVIVSAVGATPVTSSAATLTVAASAGLVVTTDGSGTGSWSGAGTLASKFVRSAVGWSGGGNWVSDPVFTASGSGSVYIAWASRAQAGDSDPALYVQKNNSTVQTLAWTTSGGSITPVSVVSGDTVRLVTESAGQQLTTVSVWIQ
jgi:hypothetical protein